MLAVAAVCGGAALLQLGGFASGQGSSGRDTGSSATAGGPTDADRALLDRGRELFEEGCGSCHGLDARGVPGTGPSLRGVGAAAADFYLRTGRMPLDSPKDQPLRAPPRYPDDEIEAIVAYVGSFGGPEIPRVEPQNGSLSEGLEAFSFNCSGCHAITGRGGVVIGAFAPTLVDASATEVAEAIRVGPDVMPKFNRERIDGHTLNSIVAYVEGEGVKQPDNRGGWAIGNLGPVPEGLVAWLLAAAVLLLVARVIGTRGEE